MKNSEWRWFVQLTAEGGEADDRQGPNRQGSLGPRW